MNFFIIIYILLLSSFFGDFTINKPVNYNEYHKMIIDAENDYFIKKNYREAFIKYKIAFERFDFVFIDDCIEAFQLALVKNDNNLALYF